MLRKQISVDSLEIDISAEKADQAVEDVALGDICNEDRDVISFHKVLRRFITTVKRRKHFMK